MSDPRDEFRAVMLRDLGAAPDSIEPGKLHRFATRDRRGDDAGFCKLFEDMRGGVYGCNRQYPGQVFTWSGVDRDRLTRAERADMARQVAHAVAEREAAQRRQWQANAGRLAELWGQSVPVAAGDPVGLYLAHRLRGALPTVPDCLRLHPALPYWLDGAVAGTWPAMVARLTALDGRLVALHRTWLTPEGRKAPAPGPVKKLTRTAGPLGGACIRLSWPTSGGAAGIAEGIETALAAHCASGVPTVAAYSAGALAAWQWPQGLRRLVVFADADPAGAEAAEKLRQRGRASGLSVEVLTPATPGADWCDVWADRGAVSVEVLQ